MYLPNTDTLRHTSWVLVRSTRNLIVVASYVLRGQSKSRMNLYASDDASIYLFGESLVKLRGESQVCNAGVYLFEKVA